ncbi:MAG: alcohol dehydrogenase catalytic domain-containing protein [Selenomonas artemidis]|jgi:oxidoreductase
MKAVVVYEAGGAQQLVYTDVPRPTIKEGRSLVKVRGFGINHSEIFTRQGLSPSVKFPRILGIECVGTVEETTEPERLPFRRRVVSIMGEMGRAFDGSYAE